MGCKTRSSKRGQPLGERNSGRRAFSSYRHFLFSFFKWTIAGTNKGLIGQTLPRPVGTGGSRFESSCVQKGGWGWGALNISARLPHRQWRGGTGWLVLHPVPSPRVGGEWSSPPRGWVQAFPARNPRREHRVLPLGHRRDRNQLGRRFPLGCYPRGPGAQADERASGVGEVAAASCTGHWGICFPFRLSSRRRGDLCNSILFQHCQGYARTRPGQPGRTCAICRTLRAPRDAAQGQVQPLSEWVHHVLGRRQPGRLDREQGLAAASLPRPGTSPARWRCCLGVPGEPHPIVHLDPSHGQRKAGQPSNLAESEKLLFGYQRGTSTQAPGKPGPGSQQPGCPWNQSQ